VYDPIQGEEMNKTNTTTLPSEHPAKKSAARDKHHLPKVNNSAHVDEVRLVVAVSGGCVKSSGEHLVTTIEEKAGLYPAETYSQNRLSSLLFKQKEQLKKEIARKRNVLEEELLQIISLEVDTLKQQAILKLGPEALTFGSSSAAGRKQQTQPSSGTGVEHQTAMDPAPSAAASTLLLETSNAAHQVLVPYIIFSFFFADMQSTVGYGTFWTVFGMKKSKMHLHMVWPFIKCCKIAQGSVPDP